MVGYLVDWLSRSDVLSILMARSMNRSNVLPSFRQPSSDCTSTFKPLRNNSFSVSSTHTVWVARVPNSNAYSAAVFLPSLRESNWSPALFPPSGCSNTSCNRCMNALKDVRFGKSCSVFTSSSVSVFSRASCCWCIANKFAWADTSDVHDNCWSHCWQSILWQWLRSTRIEIHVRFI